MLLASRLVLLALVATEALLRLEFCSTLPGNPLDLVRLDCCTAPLAMDEEADELFELAPELELSAALDEISVVALAAVEPLTGEA